MLLLQEMTPMMHQALSRQTIHWTLTEFLRFLQLQTRMAGVAVWGLTQTLEVMTVLHRLAILVSP